MTRLGLSAIMLAACTIPPSDFHATVAIDGGNQNVAPITIITSVDRLAIDEGGSATIQLHLSAPPAGDLVVSAVLDAGPVSAAPAMAVFNATNFDADQELTLTSANDSNTVGEQQVLTLRADRVPDRAVTVDSVDKDSQNIKVAPSSVAVKEQTTTQTLQVSLTQQPSTSVKVTVSSTTGKAHVDLGQLTFTPQNYATAQTVTVDGASDADAEDDTDTIVLAATDPDHGDALMRAVPVAITDDDRRQAIKVSTTALAVAEGGTGGFDVSLLYDPGGPVTVSLADDNTGALPIDKTSISFDRTTYATPVRVTVRPPIDLNTTSETATVTLTGGGASSPSTVALIATDKTVVETFGWPTPFGSTSTISAGFAIAYQLTAPIGDIVDTFHTYVPTAVGLYRMALYTDGGGAPGTLIAEMGDGQALVNGNNTAQPLSHVALLDGAYFLVIRFSANVNIGTADAATTGRQCIRNIPYSSISDAWTSPFGASSCQNAPLTNIWFTATHQ